MRRRLAAPVALCALAALLLTGCSASVESEVAPGDLVAGEKRTDARGEYTATELSEEAPARQWDAVLVTDPDGIFTEEEILDGQRWLARWVSEVAVDGPLLERGGDAEAEAEFAAQAVQDWLDPDFADGLLGPVLYEDGTVGSSGLVVSDDALGIEFRFVRDGGQRFLGGTLRWDSVQAGRFEDGTAYLEIAGTADYTARVDEGVLREQLATVQDRDEAELLDEHPSLADDREEQITLRFDFGYRISHFAAGWRITRVLDGQSVDYVWQG